MPPGATAEVGPREPDGAASAASVDPVDPVDPVDDSAELAIDGEDAEEEGADEPAEAGRDPDGLDDELLDDAAFPELDPHAARPMSTAALPPPIRKLRLVAAAGVAGIAVNLFMIFSSIECRLGRLSRGWRITPVIAGLVNEFFDERSRLYVEAAAEFSDQGPVRNR